MDRTADRSAGHRALLWIGLGLGCAAIVLFVLREDVRREDANSQDQVGIQGRNNGESELASPPDDSPVRIPQSPMGAPDLASQATIVRTVDEKGLSVAGAELFTSDTRLSSPHFERLGVTGGNGEYRCGMDLTPPLWIASKAPGYSSQDVLFEKTVPQVITITLRMGGSIRGVVVQEETGDSIGLGATVIAWPSQVRIPAPDLAKRALAGDPLCAMCTTDVDGKFLIEGLDEAKPYTLVAGTKGFGMASPVADILPSPESITVKVSRLFGIRVRLVDRNDKTRTLPANLLPPTAEPMHTHVPLATYIPQPSFASLLAGIKDITPYRTAARSEYLFVSAVQLDRVGPLSYSAQYFGFQPIEETLWALPVDDSIQEAVLELVPVTEARGSIDVTFFGVAEGLEGNLYRQGGIGEVVLIAASGERLSYGIRTFHEPTTLADVPFGEYQSFFYCYSTSFRYPENDFHHLTVGDTPTEFLVDLTASGALELVPHKQDKSPYFGPLSSYIMAGDAISKVEAHRGGPAIFERPPFIISGIQPGRYSIFVMNPLPAPGGESFRVVEITSGRTTKLDFELAD